MPVVKQISAVTSPGAKLIGVVKADAYGHGAVQVAGCLIESGADMLAVSQIDEALQLRLSGIKSPILILSDAEPERAEELIRYSITQTVFAPGMAKSISDAAVRTGKKAIVHIKIDSGMGRVGFRAEEPDYLDFSLNLKTLCVDEPSFNYSNIPPYLICAALDNILGEDLGGFIEDNILKPLGIDKYEYGRSPEGIFYGSSKMKLTVNGLSRIGLLMMNNGMFEGRRIISEEYVRMATSKQMNNREGGYGYYFWIYRDGFSINGKLKQKCYCLPSGGLMITYLAHIEDDLPDLKESMERNILDI